MRIIITSLLSPWDSRHGGGQISTHSLAVALARRGHELTLLCTSQGGARPPGAPADLPYHLEFLPHHERLYLIPIDYARRLRGARGSADVIYTKAFTGAFLGRASSADPPRVATTHHPNPADLTAPPPWTHPRTRARWIRHHVLPLLERRTLSRANVVVCVSHHSARVLEQRGYLTPGTDVRVVHNGSPMDRITRTDREALPKERSGSGGLPGSLLCIARLDEHKGIDVLLRALTHLSDLSIRLDLVGTGLAEGALRDEAKRLGVESRVHWHGHADRDRVREHLKRAEILVLPSRSENFPLVILEAMHAGLAIVATAVGGIPEAVRDGREALLVPPENAEALAGALRRVIVNDELRRTLGAGASERANEFTWDRSAERMESIYLELCG